MGARQVIYNQELLETEQEWVRAHHEMDLQAIATILDDDYAQLNWDGMIIGKQELLAYASLVGG